MQRAKIQGKNQKWNPFSLWFVILIFMTCILIFFLSL